MNKNYVKILGCGASSGCPIIGCKCEICTSENPKNNRTRTSLYIKYNDFNILIDSGPDLRYQMLREKISHIDYVLYTHKHIDHTIGMDDLRASFFYKKSVLHCYGDLVTIKHCYHNFQHLFLAIDYFNQGERVFFQAEDDFPKKAVVGHIISDYEKITLSDLKIQTFLQHHNRINSIGYLFPDYNFAYSTDFHEISDQSLDLLKKAKLKNWIVSLTSKEGNNAHASISKIKMYNEFVQPERMILTHMGHTINYEDRSYLEDNMFFGYDGMAIEL
jgi:phosphoribosyl 1,2-cyclic phosphate phosphodiesterase